MNDTLENRVVCVWAGSFASEQDHRDYMDMQYDDDGDATSRFGIDTGLEWYDEDFLESWWIEGFSAEKLETYVRGVLHSDVFYDELKDIVAGQNANVFVFMFGERGEYPTNEELFDYDGHCSDGAKVVHVFKKTYAAP